jgi:hypothetical protein
MKILGGKFRVVGLIVLGLAAPMGCSNSAGGTDGGGADGGGGGGGSTPVPFGGVTFPWTVFDGSVPDVPLATAPAKTWYCDAGNGNDSFDGTSATMTSATVGPKKTLTAMLTSKSVKAGDTILLAGGIYRERPNFNSLTGMPGSPITIGSYGRGTGAPIIDGGIKPNAWTHYSANGQKSVWQTSTSGLAQITSNAPVLGIYVHSGSTEAALREVPHGQLTPYPNDPLPPNQTQADLTDNSSNWFFDASAKVLYADFGGTLGSGDPNNADVSILYNSANGSAGHEPLIVLAQGHGNFTFVGLTLRAGSWHGSYAETSGNTFDRCDVKFNGGGGIAFDTGQNDPTISGNSVTNTRIWMNVLHNWPRFNNGNTGGGWPGGLSWYSQSNALAQGNIVYGNGGEGLVIYGTNSNSGAAHVSMNNEVRNNIVFDNWSVNVYLDNTQNVRIEANFVFEHPRDNTLTFTNLLTVSKGYDTDFGKRLTPTNISLADEPGSAFDSEAHLSDITVINNIFAGGKFGFIDYDDGTKTVFHGLKNCTITNNTWVLSSVPVPGQSSFVWRHLFVGANPDASSNSFLQNNIMATAEAMDDFVQADEAGAGPGITNDYNFYSGPGQWITVDKNQDFTTWKSGHTTWDQHSVTGDAMLTDASEFSHTAVEKPVYDWSKAVPLAGSPTVGTGLTQQNVAQDFTDAPRSGANDIGAVAHH